jgi:hypothetical protein
MNRINKMSSGKANDSEVSNVTHSMEHSPSWEADRFAASQEIPHIL